MLVLALDTCFLACSAALYDAQAGQVLAERFELLERGHAERLPVLVAECFHEAGVVSNAVQRIAVTRGPGTFTGLRVGLAYAHGMATASGCDVVGVSSLLAMALPALKTHRKLAVVQVAGATGKLYAALVEDGGGEPDLHFARAQDLLNVIPVGTPVIGTGTERLLAAGGSYSAVAGFDQPRASCFALYASELPKPKHGLPQPVYLREPDAKPSQKTFTPQVRRAQVGDTETLAKLHGQSFREAWTEQAFRASLMLSGNLVLIVSLDGHDRGFVQVQMAADEAEIQTICVEPRWRRRGFAKTLVDSALDLLRTQNIKRLHLEVAEDNSHAIALYERKGFHITGRRKGYYKRKDAAAVDAILMSRDT